MEERLTTEEALNHPYLEEARLRFHSCMCTCCHDVPVTGPSSTQNIQMTSKPEQEKMSSSSLYASEDGLTKAIASTSRVFEASSGSVASDLSPTNSVCPPSNSLLSYTSSRHQQQHSQPVYNQHNLNNIQSNQQQQSSTQPVHSQTVSQQYSHYATHQQLASQQHSALHHSSQYQSVTQGHHNSRHSLNSSSLTPGTPEGGGIINNVGVDQQSIGYSNRTAAAGCSPDSSIAVGSSNASCGSLASEAAAVDSSSSGTVFSHAQSSGGALSPTRRIFCLDLDPICLTPPPLEMEIQFGRVVNVKSELARRLKLHTCKSLITVFSGV
ncbi:unnamed protein product [Protopolystoma xenopodis]|uniref:Protein kinase domain-containing protein n=1 Tax=Protopolystoma xenopodis TaxID=117903 RepID=A0A3S4ZRL2_9PLAT|nr:unnamed protein product [Protopolystoma xenopodis]